MTLALSSNNSAKFLACLFAAAMVVSLFFPNKTFTETAIDCPKELARLENDAIPPDLLLLFEKTYEKLGCPIKLTPLPGRRGAKVFNHGQVDGEAFRIPHIEKLYTRDFVRSEEPLFTINNSLWINPYYKSDSPPFIGYILGVFWQERYKYPDLKKSYHTTEKLYHAYNSGFLDGFLSTDFYVHRDIKKGRFLAPPIRREKVSTVPIFHYLDKKYEPFMKRFSQHVKKEHPFQKYAEKAAKKYR